MEFPFKIDKIKTEQEFWEFSDVWYQRTLRLANVAFDKNEALERRKKAFVLWFVMRRRMMVLFEIGKRISLRPMMKFQNGSSIEFRSL